MYVYIYLYVDVIYACIHIATLYWIYRTTYPEIFSMGATSAPLPRARNSVVPASLASNLATSFAANCAFLSPEEMERSHTTTHG